MAQAEQHRLDLGDEDLQTRATHETAYWIERARDITGASARRLPVPAVAFDLRDRLGFVSGLPWIGRKLNAIAPAAKRFLAGGTGIETAVAQTVNRLVALVRPADGRPPSSDRPGGE